MPNKKVPWNRRYAAGRCHVDLGGPYPRFGPHRSKGLAQEIPSNEHSKKFHVCDQCGCVFYVDSEKAKENTKDWNKFHNR